MLPVKMMSEEAFQDRFCPSEPAGSSSRSLSPFFH